jgi:small conductance mechanosensitive channel
MEETVPANATLDAIAGFAAMHVAELSWILGLLLGGRLLLKLLASRIIRAAEDGDDSRMSGREKRAKTLASLVTTAGNVLILVIVLLMTMRLFGVDTTPILASAGVVGFAVGFGMQTLVKDFVSGVFIFAENQFAVGDRVKIGAFEGTVHRMSMRSTVLADGDGNLVFLPNGSIANVVNLSLKARKGAKAAARAENGEAKAA